MKTTLRAVAWETTRRCDMQCKHCRGDATSCNYSDELTTEEGMRLIDGIAAFSNPILILTGGEPLMRDDIFELAAHASASGITPVMAPCGPLVTPEVAAEMKKSGVTAVSISIDGATPKTHDAFRGVSGAFDSAMRAIQLCKEAGIGIQINCTVSKLSVEDLPAIYDMAVKVGAQMVDFFFLVPTGRGSALKNLELDAERYEATLNWIYELSLHSTIGVKCTCAPHYARLQRQRAGADFKNIQPRFQARGCLGGKGFIFISHRGVVQPCGFLNLECGDMRQADFNLQHIYEDSKIFNELRDTSLYSGSCGRCGYVDSCGGCRARAYESTGDYLTAEPHCLLGDQL